MKLGSLGKATKWVLVLFVISFCIVYYLIAKVEPLPVYQPSDINPKLVDPSLQSQQENHRILDFTLTNQDGEQVTLEKVKGKIVVADFFFTTCGSICPRMTDEMQRVATEFADNSQVHFLSHTVLPSVDTVETLRRYADNKALNLKHWDLLTGPKDEIYKLARKSYFAVIDEPSDEGPDFIHTENFVLVDTQGQLRGFYDGTKPKSVNRLIDDIKTLLEE